MKLYHVSPTLGITELQPRISTHGKPLVYATENLNFALFFGSRKSNGDFDGIYGIEGGRPFFYEAFSGAFRHRFDGESCYVYEVDPEGFESGKTSFRGEVVSETPAKILNCEKIDNLYEYLMKKVENGEIILKEYDKNDKNYIEMMEEHIKDRLKKFNILDDKEKPIYKFCEEHFTPIINDLQKEDPKGENYGVK